MKEAPVDIQSRAKKPCTSLCKLHKNMPLVFWRTTTTGVGFFGLEAYGRPPTQPPQSRTHAPTAWCLFVCGRLPPECKVEATMQHAICAIVAVSYTAGTRGECTPRCGARRFHRTCWMNLLGIAWEGFRKYPGSMSEEGCPAKEFLVQPGLPTAWCLFVCGRLPPECKVEATIQHVVGLVVSMRREYARKGTSCSGGRAVIWRALQLEVLMNQDSH